jgi:hypothetical protein
MSTHNNLIKVTYYFNDVESSVTFDSNNKVSVLRSIISLSLKVNLNEYDIMYNKKRIGSLDDRLLKEVIGNDRNPVFFIKKGNLEKKINIEENDFISKLKNRIIVENFPSSNELLELLNNFLEKRNYSKKYDSEHKRNAIEFSFANPVNIKF